MRHIQISFFSSYFLHVWAIQLLNHRWVVHLSQLRLKKVGAKSHESQGNRFLPVLKLTLSSKWIKVNLGSSTQMPQCEWESYFVFKRSPVQILIKEQLSWLTIFTLILASTGWNIPQTRPQTIHSVHVLCHCCPLEALFLLEVLFLDIYLFIYF
jgi:hypothetical protein